VTAHLAGIDTATLVGWNLTAIWSAMALYALSFIAFTFDLATRVAPARAAVTIAASGAASVSSGGSSTAVLERTVVEGADGQPKRSRWVRLAMILLVMAWVLHVGGTVVRGIAAGRVPWANMFEFSLTATAIVVGVFLAVQLWQDLRFLGAFISGFVLLFLGIATVNFYVDVVPLPPALQSYWLVIHVFVASLGTGFFALGGALSVVQLLKSRRDYGRMRFLTTFPEAERVENMSYRLIIVGFIFWTFTLIAGAIWANHAWGRYWGWDTKEVWTFIVWVIYAGYIHARSTKGWRGSRSAWLALVGFSAVLFNFTIVNLFFKGFHAYSGL
jgi:cytochrome c-type biogenesis protein CcsB